MTEPADVVLPEDNVFTDHLDNTSNLFYVTGNVINAWSPEEDIANFFNGDSGRIARSDGEEAYIVWNYESIADFSITVYFCGDPGDDFSFVMIQGASSPDLGALSDIPVEFSLQETRGDWREYRVTPAEALDGSFNYLAVHFLKSERTPAGWEFQVADVTLSDNGIE